MSHLQAAAKAEESSEEEDDDEDSDDEEPAKPAAKVCIAVVLAPPPFDTPQLPYHRLTACTNLAMKVIGPQEGIPASRFLSF